MQLHHRKTDSAVADSVLRLFVLIFHSKIENYFVC